MTDWPVGLGGGVLLYGGTFDPPHLGHVELAITARDAAMPRAWLVYVPAGRNPLKSSGPVASGADRAAMLGLAITGRERAWVWTDEIERGEAGEPTYWIDTLGRARAALGDGPPLRFLIGADQASSFHRWRSAREVLSIARPVVMPRAPVVTADDLEAVLAETGAWTEAERAAWRGWLVAINPLAARATDVRTGDDTALDPRVAAYIREHGLYARTS